MRGADDPWWPWKEARSRHRLEVGVIDLPAGITALHAKRGDHRAILLSKSLTRVERVAALLHELVHDDCDGGLHEPGMPDRLRPLVARDEARVNRLCADLLLPPERLMAWVEAEVAEGRQVTLQRAVEDFDVAEWIADLQLSALWRQRVA